MLVDAQVHLWKANTPGRPWLPNRVAQLPEPTLIEQLVPMMDEAGVDRAVIVPPSWEGDRNETLDFLSDQDKEWIMGRAILERLGWK
jgi:predicted TIM-barrel fold metal-dependent hydrolase